MDKLKLQRVRNVLDFYILEAIRRRDSWIGIDQEMYYLLDGMIKEMNKYLRKITNILSED